MGKSISPGKQSVFFLCCLSQWDISCCWLPACLNHKEAHSGLKTSRKRHRVVGILKGAIGLSLVNWGLARRIILDNCPEAKFPLPKSRTIRFSLHTSHLSHFLMVTIVALKFATSSHLPLPKILASLFPLSQMVGVARRVIENQDKWSNPAQSYIVLPIEKMNQINTKNYWK